MINFTSTADFYYAYPWVNTFVTTLFSWSMIVAMVSFMFSVISSIVYKSNPILFDIVDELKSAGSEGDSAGGIFNTIKVAYSGFKTGNQSSGLNGGFDNIAVFFLMLSLNFKKYSMYANVSEGDEGGKTKLSVDDTIGSFILKISITAIIFNTVVAMTMSGQLQAVWINLADVLGSKAAILSSNVVNVKLKNMFGLSGWYSFSYATSSKPSDRLANELGGHVLTTVLSELDNVTDDQAMAIGVAIEEGINGNNPSIFAEGSVIDGFYNGNDVSDYSNILTLVNANIPETQQLTVSDLNDDLVMSGVTLNGPVKNGSPSDASGQQIVFSTQAILNSAGLSTLSPKEQYIHFSLNYKTGAARSQTVTETDTSGVTNTTN